MKELEKKYNPSEFEGRLYSEWCDKGYFAPRGDGEAFSIVMPPPNITGLLHLGHALDNTMQDVLTRYKRMCGFRVLWIPGTDHASIATEAKIVEAMRKEGLSKQDVGREKFLERAWEWKEKYDDRIVSQLKRVGSSCDWKHKRFTMDEGCSEAVREVFVRLYEKGLIYRGERIINWCPHCHTSISNAEVEHEQQSGHFWHIRYPLVGGGGYVEVATTRPETMLGDTAVAVNPNDERYKDLIGKYVVLPLVGRRIPIVGDEHAQLDKGTGCVKITPAHDPNDFEVGRRQKLPMEVVLTEDAKITENYPKYAGMDRYTARKAILNDLKEGGYLAEVEDITHEVGTCYRCGTTIEPMISLQWFVRMEPLAAPAIEAVKNGDIKFVPARFEKLYFNWMENTQDWCISRQLWWGHRIPAYYCDCCGETVVAKTAPKACPKCGGHMTQDDDTLDTWFSSALWPFSTLGWPKQTKELEEFFPTNVLVTGYDIITFWVSRMIFSALEYTGKKPFSDVLIHGIVRDSQGRKMSKSLGNGVDPIEIIDRYGADALRFMLITGNSAESDQRFYEERVESCRNFANKIWNAARFVLMNLDLERPVDKIDVSSLQTEDKWVLSLYNKLVQEVRDNIDRYELGLAAGKLYDFIWDVFCDWYIELVKGRLNDKACKTNTAAQETITYVLSGTLKLLHPFMPFITEEIWRTLPHEGDSIMISSFPVSDEALSFPQDEEVMSDIITCIRAIRNRRAEMNVAPSRKAHVNIVSGRKEVFEGKEGFFMRLAGASEVSINPSSVPEGALQIITDCAAIYIPMQDIIDTEAEIARLEKELEKAEVDIARGEGKLANDSFVSRAPEAVVKAEREKLEKALAVKAKVLAALEKLK